MKEAKTSCIGWRAMYRYLDQQATCFILRDQTLLFLFNHKPLSTERFQTNTSELAVACQTRICLLMSYIGRTSLKENLTNTSRGVKFGWQWFRDYTNGAHLV
ncbi:hypothetical protein V565_015910 [Rhizoctonia solani 123E]|uniref:Uncharacterized protein n=1 Tax=Rhizoctonia solani 123E TaxID=1423351 RepID=A0A074SCI5_9AGAM|nr:hypothetical protein V565_015910 [Rhizoctonia solani 123E]